MNAMHCLYECRENLKKRVPLFIFLTCLVLVHVFFWFSVSGSRAVLLVGGLLIVGLIFIYILIFKDVNFSKLYLAVLLCSGMVFSIFFTPFSVPDEDYHFAASYSWSNLIMGYGYQEEDPLVMRECDAEFYKNKSSRIDRTAILTLIDGLKQPFSFENNIVLATTNRSHELSSNLPQEKIPSAIGITLARLLGLSPYYLFLIGRLCNVLVSSLLFYLAFRISPIGKNAFVCTSLLPMTLHLGASYSYDSFIIPMGALLAALYLRAIYAESRISKIEIAQLLIGTALLAPCKIIYSFIALLAILIPVNRFKSKGSWFVFVCSCLLTAFFAIGLSRLGSFIPMSSNEASQNVILDKRGEETGVFYTLSDAIHQPLDIFMLIFKTLDVYAFDYLKQMTGCSLGWLQSELIAPGVYTVVYLLFLLISGQADFHDGAKQPIWHRFAELLIFIAVGLSVMLVMLFSWTFNTETVISGVQGRYFLPALVLLLLSIRVSHLTFDVVLTKVLFIGILYVNSFYLIRTFAIAIALG